MHTHLVKVTALLTLFTAVPFLLAGTAAAEVTFDWVTVGDIGNTADDRIMDKGPGPDLTTGYGSVGYRYRIAKTHVTNSQWAEFLNAVDPDGDEANPIFNDPGGIFNFNMWMVPNPSGSLGLAHQGGIDFNLGADDGSKYSAKSGEENYPAIWINWNSAARFVNWLSNGQGSGDTESGVYNGLPQNSGDPTPFREAGATIFLPSEDEFYKAAYYNPDLNDGAGGYTEFGVGDALPVSEGPSGGTTSANYAIDAGRADHASGDTFWQNNHTPATIPGGGFDKSLVHLTEVGAYMSATSHYGLYDVDGLVYQWTDDGRQRAPNVEYDFPVFRGGSWSSNDEFVGAAYRNLYSFPNVVSHASYGLRIASAVPVLQGDFNGDGFVDAKDYNVWRNNLGAADESALMGGGDGLNGVDEADYTLWKNNFGAGAAGAGALAASSVPEPSTLLLGLFASLGLLLRPTRLKAIGWN
ncbi:MAG: formylglycine-generating enzyme family protein [Aeoliella sp.]